MKVLPYGERAVLVDVGDPAQVLIVASAARRLDGVLEAVPAASTVLLEFEPAATDPVRLADALAVAVHMRLASRQTPRLRHRPGLTIELPVRYDGIDLAAVANEVGLSVDEVIARHCAGSYLVAFCGFAPGFAYLTGLDPQLRLPRLAEPRTAVPAGSVGIADQFTGMYPRVSPGGWRLLGRTDAVLWDPSRTPPALLRPGMGVRFRPA